MVESLPGKLKALGLVLKSRGDEGGPKNMSQCILERNDGLQNT